MMKPALILICYLAAVSTGIGQGVSNFNLQDGLALQGYDPVAYFDEKKARMGRPEFSHQHEGVTYHFISESNRNKFVQRPAQYLPQYGGWCAYAMGATGEKVDVDPETFKLMDGKLYLFYNKFFNNTLPKWNKEESSLKAKADRNWNAINHSKP